MRGREYLTRKTKGKQGDMRRGQRAREEPSRRDGEMSRGQRAAYEGD